MGCKKAINILSPRKFITIGSSKNLTLKLTMLLALTSPGRAPVIAVLTEDITNHHSEYIFQIGKTSKTSLRKDRGNH